MKLNFKTATLFLNRSCPRGCTQCGISKLHKPHLSITQWMEKIKMMRDELGVEFFLILGTEPLLFGDDLVRLIEFFTRENIFYGWYSTAPPKLWEKYKQPLLDAGLTNLSAGIDTLPGVGLADATTEKKVEEAWEALQWMAERGVQIFTVTTVTNYNLSYVPLILEKAQKELGNCMSCINPVEWAHNAKFDFFSPKEQMTDFIIPESRHEEVIEMVEKVLKMTRHKGWQIQNPDSHLLNFPRQYHKLNYKCGGKVGFGVDCDGSLRACGYQRGVQMPRFTVDDLVFNRPVDAYMAWVEEMQNCEGCHWSYVQALEENFESLIPNSNYYKHRYNEPIPDLRAYLSQFPNMGR